MAKITIEFKVKNIKNPDNERVSDGIGIRINEIKDPLNNEEVVKLLFVNSSLSQANKKKIEALEVGKTYSLSFDEGEVREGMTKGNKGPGKGGIGDFASSKQTGTASGSESKKEPPKRVSINTAYKEISIFVGESDFNFEINEKTSDGEIPLNFQEETKTKDKKTCPQCQQKFDALSSDGYCSQKCKDEAAQQRGNEYTCTKCNKKFTDAPTIKDGKKYCSNCKEKDQPKPEEPEYKPQDDIDKAKWERQAKLAQNKTELQNLINQGQNQENIEYLKATLEKIEQKSSTSAYQELKTQIDSLHFKLNSKLSISEVQQKEVSKLKLLLTQNNLEKEDLPTETQTELDNLKNIPDLGQIANKTNSLSQKIKQIGAGQKFNSLLSQINSVSASDNVQKAKLKADLEKLMASDNHFIQEFIKNHQPQIENALSKLSTQQEKNNTPNNKQSVLSTGKKVAIGVGVGGGAALLFGLTVFVVHRKKKISPHSTK
ncbi:MAG: hypothetical protein MRERC_3c057 [Mycoplasmataceae bacterium RC_NB112A]|nr:MAG: hypothetical protein MRERC_3c057 [Mycoplasmataceae bacterium RC_NB112A]